LQTLVGCSLSRTQCQGTDSVSVLTCSAFGKAVRSPRMLNAQSTLHAKIQRQEAANMNNRKDVQLTGYLEKRQRRGNGRHRIFQRQR
jgi:hypothetical protein